jgi:hypothetical protein
LYGKLNAADSLEAVEAWMATGTPVLNALNTRYVVLDGNYPPLVNDGAFGAAWFVDSVALASTPDEEIALLGSVDLRRQAVVTTLVALPAAPEAPVTPGETGDLIRMTSYAPNELHYQYTASTDRLAVFSEIYYPNGWHATVDGEPLALLRADWTLRAALLPAGSHEVVMTFLPDSYRIGATVSRVASLTLLVLLVLALALPFVLRKGAPATGSPKEA